MSTMFVVPGAGVVIADPDTGDILPASGGYVADNAFWLRRIADGEVVATTPGSGVVVPSAPIVVTSTPQVPSIINTLAAAINAAVAAALAAAAASVQTTGTTTSGTSGSTGSSGGTGTTGSSGTSSGSTGSTGSSGTTTPTPALIAAATASLGFSGRQFSGNTGIADLGNVTLTGDWTFGLVTKVPSTSSQDYRSGFIAAIGTADSTALHDPGSLSMVYSGQYFPAWGNHTYQGGVSLVAVDNNGQAIAGRNTEDTLYGDASAQPLVSSYLADDGTHGLFVVCRSGILEWWHVDSTGTATIMDTSAGTFAGISNKPLRIGGPMLTPISSANGSSAFWSEPVQGVVVAHTAATPAQMGLIMAGADARNVLSLSAAAGDLYFPGTVSGSSLVELVSGANGVISGSGTSTGGDLLAGNFADLVTLDQDAGPSVLPRAVAPATSSPLAIHGLRNGVATTIQLQVVKAYSTAPASGTDIVDGWQTVASNVGTGSWAGSFVSTNAHAAPLGQYDWEERHLQANGTYSAPIRQSKVFSLGMTVVAAGQSIVQKFYDGNGSSAQTAISPALQAAMRFYNNPSNLQVFSSVVNQTSLQGWQGVSGYGQFGVSNLVQDFGTLAAQGLGYANAAIGGQSITAYIPATTSPFARMAKSIQRTRPQVIVWGNGQADAGMSQATRWAALDTFMQQVDAVVAAAPGGPWTYVLALFPINNDFGPGDADPGPIRQIDMDWVASRNATRPANVAHCSSVQILTYLLDATLSDGTHPTDDATGNGLFASRYAQTLAYIAGAASGPGYGPSWSPTTSSFTSDGSTTIVKMALAARADVTGLLAGLGGSSTASVSGAEISVDGSNWLAATGTIVSATEVDFAVSAAPSSTATTVQWRYLHGRPGSATGSSSGSPSAAQAGTSGALYDQRGMPVPPAQNPLTITGSVSVASSGGTGNGGGSTGNSGVAPSLVAGQLTAATNVPNETNTLTLPSAPTPGNSILVLVFAYTDAGYTAPVPTGFQVAAHVRVDSENRDFTAYFGPVSALDANGGVTVTSEYYQELFMVETTAQHAVGAALNSTDNQNSPTFTVQVPPQGGTNPLWIGFYGNYVNTQAAGGYSATGGTIIYQDYGHPNPGGNYNNYNYVLFEQDGSAPVTFTQASGINTSDLYGIGVELT